MGTGSDLCGISSGGRVGTIVTGEGELTVKLTVSFSDPSPGMSVLGVTNPTWRTLGPITSERRLDSIAATGLQSGAQMKKAS